MTVSRWIELGVLAWLGLVALGALVSLGDWRRAWRRGRR